MRKILYVLGGLVVLIVAAAVLAPQFIDVNDYKSEILAQVKAKTGRDATIDGRLELSLLPSPMVSADGVALANAPGGSAAQMVHVRSLKVRVAALPLLSGRIDVTQIALVEPRIVLEQLPGGRGNWQFGSGQNEVPSSPGSSSGAGSDVSVRDVVIENGTLVWRDADRLVQLDRLNARLRADSLQGPFNAAASFESKGVPVALEIRFGQIASGPQPASIRIETAGGALAFDGTVADPLENLTAKGSLKADGGSFAAFVGSLATVAGDQPPPLPPAFASKFALAATIEASGSKVQADPLSLSLAGESGQGKIAFEAGERDKLDVSMAFAKIDFDRLLAAAADDGKAAKPDAPVQSAGSDKTPASALQRLDGSLDLSVGTIVYQGRTAQQVAVKAELAGGTLTLHRLGGQFPGNTTIAASGKVDAAQAQPSGGGKIDIASDRLRDFLGWLDVDVAQVPADRLNALRFTGNISATAEGDIRISDASAKIDSTTARGAVTLRTSPRLAVVADLDVDTVNVDAYLGGRKPEAQPKSGDGKSAGGPPLDAVIKVRVAQLTWQDTQIEGVNVDLTASGDKLTFRPSRVASLAGASLAWNGTVADFDGNPAIDLTVDLKTQDADRLLKLAGIASPVKQRIGPVSASGKVAGRPEALMFNGFALSALGSTAKLTGRLQPKGPTYDLSRLELRTDDADRLFAILGIEPPLGKRKIGAATVTGSAKGDANQATIDLDVAAQGATFDLKGNVTGLKTAVALAMDVGVRHPDFQRFMRLLLPDYGGGAGVGAIAFTARVEGRPDAELRVADLRGTLGSSSVTGNISANLAGAVPEIVMSLETGILEIDRVLPLGQRAGVDPDLRTYPSGVVPASGGVLLAQASARGARFSRDAIDVSALRAANARIDLRSQALSLPPWRVENAVAKIDLRDGVLNVTQLTGRAFDGDFSLTGVLNAAQLPARMNASLRASQIDMGQLSRALAQKDRFDGRMTVALDLAGAGSSEADIVSSLNGNGSLGGKIRLNTSFVETAGGLVAGQAAKQLDKLLGNLVGNKNATVGGGDLNAAINVVLARFANRDGDASGTLTIRNGVARSTDLVVTGTRARAETTLVASLPAWTLDATTNVLLDENPREPYLIVINRGPLDSPSLNVSRGAARASDEPVQQQAPQQQAPQQQQQPGQYQQQPQQQSPPSNKKKAPSFKDLLKKL
ncbi:MAG: AsmA family protein [Reyranellaceae bacterium]